MACTTWIMRGSCLSNALTAEVRSVLVVLRDNDKSAITNGLANEQSMPRNERTNDHL